MKPGIMFYIPALAGGGIERVISLLSRGLADDYCVYVLPQVCLDDSFAESVREYVKLLPGYARSMFQRNIFVGFHVIRLVSEVVKHRPVVIISAYPRVHLAVALGLSLMPSHIRPKWIATEHGDPDLYLGRTWWRRYLKLRLVRWALDQANLRLAVSEAVKRKAEGLYRLPFRVARNPVEIGVFFEEESEGFSESPAITVLSMGRLVRNKGFDVLICAFSRVLRRFPDAQLIILGEGSDRIRLEQLVKTLGIEANVQLPGFVSKPWAYLQKATLFAFPSFSEGQALAVIEAMLAGLPIVASDIDAIREVADENCMVFVPPGNVDALAESMIFLLSNPEVRKKLGSNAQEKARVVFSVKAAVETYRAAIREVLECGRDRTRTCLN